MGTAQADRIWRSFSRMPTTPGIWPSDLSAGCSNRDRWAIEAPSKGEQAPVHRRAQPRPNADMLADPCAVAPECPGGPLAASHRRVREVLIETLRRRAEPFDDSPRMGRWPTVACAMLAEPAAARRRQPPARIRDVPGDPVQSCSRVGGDPLQAKAESGLVFINRGDVTTLDLQRMLDAGPSRGEAARGLSTRRVHHDHPSPAWRSVGSRPRRLTWAFHPGPMHGGPTATRVTQRLRFSQAGALPELASDYQLFSLMRGGRAFYDWRAGSTRSVLTRNAQEPPICSGVHGGAFRTVGARGRRLPMALTLRVELEHRCPYFLDVMAFACLYPVYPPLVRQYERPDPSTGRLVSEHGWTKPPHLVSNGPFVLTQWRFKRDMWLEQNPHFWNLESLAIRTIMIPSVEDPNSQVLAFRTGAVDYLTDVSTPYRGDMVAQKLQFYEEHREEVEALRALGLDQIEIDRRLPNDPRAHIHPIPSFGTYFYTSTACPRSRTGVTIPSGTLASDVRSR